MEAPRPPAQRTVPLPVPDVPAVIVIQLLAVTVQEHPGAVVIASVPVPPVADRVCCAGVSE